MSTIDDPEEQVKIEIAVVVDGAAPSKNEAYELAHQFQSLLNRIIDDDYPDSLSIAVCQATIGDIEEPSG